ncbi:prolyl 4-hydroxylase subunit alpha-1-like [Drosophila miranda]|uniref:prolyl 4-hydroxylase subunit alpha-1-like n=1 Tax=Drosophila miranda TaxID=7229 RepID=UPI00143F0FF9|nr:prolyl 4-hydroxylase subunit alpha-1-like [Drosophila miranda]
MTNRFPCFSFIFFIETSVSGIPEIMLTRSLLYLSILVVVRDGGALKLEESEVVDQFYSTSIVSMEDLLEFHADLLFQLNSYIDVLRARMKLIRRIADYMMEHDHIVNLEDHSLNYFHLVRHMHKDWAHVLELMEQPLGKSQLLFLKESRPHYPSAWDLEEGSLGIHRMQKTYQLQPKDMVRGLLDGVHHGTRFSTLECFTVARAIYKKHRYHDAVTWLEETLSLYDQASEQTKENYQILGFDVSQAHKLYIKGLMHLNRYEDASKAIDRDPKPYLRRLRDRVQMRMMSTNDLPLGKPNPPLTGLQLCCRGGCPYRDMHRLTCSYNTTAAPFLRLAPFKTELLSLSPYMVLYHDVITPLESLTLKNLSKPHMKRRAMTFNKQKLRPFIDSGRTSNSVWLTSHENAVMERLERRVGVMTNFEMENSEVYQLINYGIGGHYKPHTDHFETPQALEHRGGGDRIATVLFYLSDVPQGGATLFPRLNISVQPRQGDALLWYNLNDRGQGEIGTVHTSCPIIKGSKWALVKWIDELSQPFRRPCNR